jgi:hypothetical protein
MSMLVSTLLLCHLSLVVSMPDLSARWLHRVILSDSDLPSVWEDTIEDMFLYGQLVSFFSQTFPAVTEDFYVGAKRSNGSNKPGEKSLFTKMMDEIYDTTAPIISEIIALNTTDKRSALLFMARCLHSAEELNQHGIFRLTTNDLIAVIEMKCEIPGITWNEIDLLRSEELDISIVKSLRGL